MNWIEVLGFVGGVLGILPALPQVRRVKSLGHGDGVSPSTWWLLFVVSMTWTGYGFRIESPSVIVTNFLAGILNAVVVAALVGRSRRPLLSLSALGIAIVGVVQFLPTSAVSVLLVVLTLARVPQVKKSWDSRHGVEESAVSLPSAGLTVASLACWELWAALARRPIVNLTTSIALALTLAIAGLEVARKRPAAALAPEVEA